MRSLFFGVKRPSFYYKSSKFYFKFRQTSRRRFLLGPRRTFGFRPSYAFRMHYLKRFFLWYYDLRNNFKFRRLFRTIKAVKIPNKFGSFLRFLYVVERFLAVFLVRLYFARNLPQARSFVELGFVFVNGKQALKYDFIVPFGALVEVIFRPIFTYFSNLFAAWHRMYHYTRRFFSIWRDLCFARVDVVDADGRKEKDQLELPVFYVSFSLSFLFFSLGIDDIGVDDGVEDDLAMVDDFALNLYILLEAPRKVQGDFFNFSSSFLLL